MSLLRSCADLSVKQGGKDVGKAMAWQVLHLRPTGVVRAVQAWHMRAGVFRSIRNMLANRLEATLAYAWERWSAVTRQAHEEHAQLTAAVQHYTWCEACCWSQASAVLYWCGGLCCTFE